jgi:hypothetical protein
MTDGQVITVFEEGGTEADGDPGDLHFVVHALLTTAFCDGKHLHWQHDQSARGAHRVLTSVDRTLTGHKGANQTRASRLGLHVLAAARLAYAASAHDCNSAFSSTLSH